MSALSYIRDLAAGRDLKRDKFQKIQHSGLVVLNSVSFALAGVSLLFLIAFQVNKSVSLSWFFLLEAVAFSMIPLLARQGYENAGKFLLIAYIDIGIMILSSVFGSGAYLQVFFVPAMGLGILLYDQSKSTMRFLAIGLSVVAYFILDYIIYDRIYFTDERLVLVKWSILVAAFITTWLIFNTFADLKESAEQEMLKLLKESRKLNQQLLEREKELEENVKELARAKAKVEEGSRAKTQFLSTMSHEIRTPMNAIIGMTNLLSQNEPREDQKEQIEILNFSSRTLLALIDDILDFSKIESGKIEFESTPFDLDQLLKSVGESFRFKAEEKGIGFEVNCDDDLPSEIVGDPARLTQILNNLLSNAVKFTDEGKVSLGVHVLDHQEDTVKLRFRVADTGIGIEPEKLQEIFDSFTQARSDTNRVFGGTGLGLAICKQLTELQGGTIDVDSKRGEGSVFDITLEFEVKERGAAQPKTKREVKDRSRPLAGARVLLVEDNMINQKVAARFMQLWDVDITIANNGEEALQAIEREAPFDLILMDLQMPEMDGYEASAKIRELDDPAKQQTPIVALTAAALQEVKEEVTQAGMNDFIAKPFNPNDLKQKLTRHVHPDGVAG